MCTCGECTEKIYSNITIQVSITHKTVGEDARIYQERTKKHTSNTYTFTENDYDVLFLPRSATCDMSCDQTTYLTLDIFTVFRDLQTQSNKYSTVDLDYPEPRLSGMEIL